MKDTCVASNCVASTCKGRGLLFSAALALAGLVKLRRPAAIAASSAVGRVNVAVATTEPAVTVTLTHSGPARPT